MIFDCFIFFNELDIVDLRFKQLNQFVDFFIVVEAEKTHLGEYKGYNFPYEKYHKIYGDKIKYFKIELLENSAWGREHENRKAIFNCLEDLNLDNEDLVFFSDCDEIWNPSVLNDAKIKNINRPIGLTQMNFVFNEKYWANTATVGTIACRFLDLKNLNEWHGDCLNFLRDKRNYIDRIKLICGKHLSYYGNFDKIVEKCSAIAEGNTNYKSEDGKKLIMQYINDAGSGKEFSFAPRGITNIENFQDGQEIEYWTVIQNQWIKESGIYVK